MNANNYVVHYYNYYCVGEATLKNVGKIIARTPEQ